MQAINPLLMLLEEQAARIDALEGRVIDLEQALQIDKAANVQAAFDISETLAQLLIMLADGKPRNKERLHAGLYYRRPEIDEPEVKIMDTLVCKLRKHVEPFGIEIATVWGSGYRIVAGLPAVRSAIEHGSADNHREIEEARERKRERERMWRRAVRAAQGGKDRQTYLQQSLSQLQPWKAAGVSRRTWYRRLGTTLQTAANDDLVVPRETSSNQAAA